MPDRSPARDPGLALWEPLIAASFFREAEERIKSGGGELSIRGLAEGARALVLLLLAHRTGRPLLVVVPDDTGLERYQRELSGFAGLTGHDPSRITVMPALDADPYGAITPHPEVVRERVVALGRLAHGEADVVLVAARALLQWLPSPEEWSECWRVIRAGESLGPDRFVLQMLSLGYRRVDAVSAAGEVSRRGGIVDVFPPSAAEPVRIELFGDVVESLRSFDTDNQRSTGRLSEVAIGPAVENPPTESALSRLGRYLEGGRQQADQDVATARCFRARLDQLEEHGYWPGIELLARLMSGRPSLLFEHAPGLTLIVDEPEKVEEEIGRVATEHRAMWEDGAERVLPEPSELFADPLEVRSRLRRAALVFSELELDNPRARSLPVLCRPARGYAGKVQDLARDLGTSLASGRRTLCLLRASGAADRLIEIFGEYGLEAKPASGLEPGGSGGLHVGVGILRSGFELPEIGLDVFAEREIFGEKRPAADRKTGSRAAFISDFRDLKQGDLVVHVDHGVGRYTGLGRPRGGSLNRDFMVLEFAAGDRLFVPADRLDLVQRYSGVAGSRPALDRLGGPGWERVKSRVRKSVQSMAKELLELYARRAAAKGHAFAPDTPWQKELEDAFPFELTPDQERVVREVKREMESTQPMDRLLVGDVGFGKTEVAVRAAFKAVMDGFQVALLAPTTVLAAQHFNTLKERYAPFPVKVELVSRFRTAGEIREVLANVALGQVDVLIGTHRMLSKDVEFKRLGLLVVDEEQRFGVAHKERLKQISVGVDVLSMTATPIPRTLQMSLGGVRDLSVIETPPPGRTAIQTYLIPFRKSTIAQAIRQELRREGQVFVVHNRIDTLHSVARAVSEMVPEARIVTAHGQMRDRQLESVMLRFVRNEADVLITTTIIENGLDIPRANTIVVNRADRMGLAQLYQLRGRVGRSHHHAYAYFVIPSRNTLSDEARKRLKALQDFSELGAGFRLAAADLEIRGAGELLGSKQHGHIASLGFDLYCQMLERAVAEMQGEPVPERRPPSLHIGVDIKIPESYLPDSSDRLALYKRLAQALESELVDRLEAETEDRFGHLPPPARHLFAMTRLRLIAEQLGVKSVDLTEENLQIRFHDEPPVEPARIIEFAAREGGRLTPSGMMTVPAPAPGEDRVGKVHEVLERIQGLGG